MQRYRSKYEVKTGDRILLDNSTGILPDLPYINFVGEVIDKNVSAEVNNNGIDENGDYISVRLLFKDGIEVNIPYYLAQ